MAQNIAPTAPPNFRLPTLPRRSRLFHRWFRWGCHGRRHTAGLASDEDPADEL